MKGLVDVQFCDVLCCLGGRSPESLDSWPVEAVCRSFYLCWILLELTAAQLSHCAWTTSMCGSCDPLKLSVGSTNILIMVAKGGHTHTDKKIYSRQSFCNLEGYSSKLVVSGGSRQANVLAPDRVRFVLRSHLAIGRPSFFWSWSRMDKFVDGR